MMLLRFDRAERIVHWLTAALVLVSMVTAAGLYVPGISTLVGRRELLKHVHVYAGLAIPVPLVAGWLRDRRGALAADLTRLNRFGPADWVWLRSFGRRGRDGMGKFNPGQKLNAAFLAGAVLVLLGTGSIMRWFAPFPDSWRTGATFVHDWTAFGVLVAVVAHVVLALRDPGAMGAMRHGGVSYGWAKAKAPAWAEEAAAAEQPVSHSR